MTSDRALAQVAAAQLAAGAAGLAVALRRRHRYEFLWLAGSSVTVPRDSLLIGTALSAPMPMMIAQVWCITGLLTDSRRAARRGLGWLGSGMVVGYLGERLVRRRLSPRLWDPVETPIAAAGLALAAAMAAMGLRR